ncbi:MAG: isocitrate lyase/phosphoenolpyruvate mutase family protein [Pseudonocardiales bacterium]|nr:isocitrate lyase/phosphoenolpyruvate mutase family protein [Pseudonocardiales bacterium]
MTGNRTTLDTAGRARALRNLHRPGQPLLLANVWDAGSATLVEEAGLPAVGTSSAAVAEALGYADREQAPVDRMLDVAERIAATVSIPVTVDVESGYGLEPDELVRRLLAAGVAGCNLEDTDHRAGTLVDESIQAERLGALRASADRAGVPLVINARVDVFLAAYAKAQDGRVNEDDLVEPALKRARAYLGAGADCVYPILAHTEDALRRFIDGVSGRPVNVLCLPGGLDPARAGDLGAARVSLGPGLWRAAQGWLRERLAVLAEGRSPY